MDKSVVEEQEVTPQNLASWHFHGDPDAFPLTAIVVLPRDEKAGTILKGRYRVVADAQVLEPIAVVDELLGTVFQVKRFFDAVTDWEMREYFEFY